jgi:hypothetical protein
MNNKDMAHKNETCKLSLRLSFLIISTITIGLFQFHPVTNILAQPAQSSIKDENILSLDVADAVYNTNTNVSEFLGSKNISLTPYRVTEEHYFEQGFLNNVGNVTNNQTFLNTYLSDELLIGRSNGTIETPDGQKITWTSSDLGRMMDGQWIFYGIMLFNSTDSESLSLLNNSIGLSRSTTGLNQPEYIWLLE